MDQQRGGVNELAGHVHVSSPELVHVCQKLRRDPRDGNVVDVDGLLADQVQQQIERAIINLAHKNRKGRLLRAFVQLFLPRGKLGGRLFLRLYVGLFLGTGLGGEHQLSHGIGCGGLLDDRLRRALWLGRLGRRSGQRQRSHRGGLLNGRSRDKLGDRFRLGLGHRLWLFERLAGGHIHCFRGVSGFRLDQRIGFLFNWLRYGLSHNFGIHSLLGFGLDRRLGFLFNCLRRNLIHNFGVHNRHSWRFGIDLKSTPCGCDSNWPGLGHSF